jgi:hypothetical protein
MATFPSREELYTLVDQEFRAAYPTAPEHLVAADPHTEAWKEAWIAVRDKVINAEINVRYWNDNPDAPEKIDPNNPAHDRFEKAWLAIRDAMKQSTPDPKVLDAAPEPPAGDPATDGGRAMGQVAPQIANVNFDGMGVRVEYWVDTPHDLDDLTMFVHCGPGGSDAYYSEPIVLKELQGIAWAELPDNTQGADLAVEVRLRAMANMVYVDAALQIPVTVSDGAIHRAGEAAVVG